MRGRLNLAVRRDAVRLVVVGLSVDVRTEEGAGKAEARDDVHGAVAAI